MENRRWPSAAFSFPLFPASALPFAAKLFDWNDGRPAVLQSQNLQRGVGMVVVIESIAAT
jgi:hypothetical protein